MTQDEINEIHTNLFLDPESVYMDWPESKIYYIDDKDDFKVFTSPVPFSSMDPAELGALIQRLPKPQE